MLEYDDNWRNIYNGCNLPCDSLSQEEIASMSSEVVTYNLSDLGGETDERAISR